MEIGPAYPYWDRIDSRLIDVLQTRVSPHRRKEERWPVFSRFAPCSTTRYRTGRRHYSSLARALLEDAERRQEPVSEKALPRTHRHIVRNALLPLRIDRFPSLSPSKVALGRPRGNSRPHRRTTSTRRERRSARLDTLFRRIRSRLRESL